METWGVILPRLASLLLGLFLIAVIVALLITLASVAAPVRLLSAVVVSPIIGLTLLFLVFEQRDRPWSFAGAAVLGAFGVCLRIIINTQPELEVGGGLPLAVTAFYLVLGSLVVVSSLWAFSLLRRATSLKGQPRLRT